MVTDVPSFFIRMTMRARWLFAMGLLGILALAGFGAWWALDPGYAALATDLRPADASEIGTALSGWGIPYRFEDGDKTVLVPRESVYSTRMKLASEGIPRGGSVGFEAFKDSDYGVTEFAQRINYQRALQGELERTIESMREVRSARVHLTLHHADLFEQDQEGSKASVSLALRDGQKLGARQVAGIQRLVASAVEGLDPANVTLLDEQGAALSGGADALVAGALGDREDQASRLEASLQAQASSLLARALHRNDFTVSVAAQLNYDRVKRVGNHVLAQGKDGHGVLVREKTDSNRASTAAANANGSVASSREVEYAHGTEQEEIVQAPGRIERISVGIVLPPNVPEASYKELSDVVAAGIGLDPSRGDHVEMATAATVSAAGMQGRAVAPSAVSAAPPSHGTPPEAQVRATFRSGLIYWIGGGATGIVFLLALGALRRPRPARLTAAERQETLARIRQWIEAPESAP
ncbi:flagellar basal-body MS-ring/collar protein FliF [Fulvimonas yonginensis]|uniref:Flagellar M-ring protein n=1 Tax=Fulvimonas yonginensis TaxID=1495200 RepID=A0ABU8JEI3_9GAMM